MTIGSSSKKLYRLLYFLISNYDEISKQGLENQIALKLGLNHQTQTSYKNALFQSRFILDKGVSINVYVFNYKKILESIKEVEDFDDEILELAWWRDFREIVKNRMGKK